MPDSTTGGGGVPRLSGESLPVEQAMAVETPLCGVPSFGVHVKEGVSVQDRCWGAGEPCGAAPGIELAWVLPGCRLSLSCEQR